MSWLTIVKLTIVECFKILAGAAEGALSRSCIHRGTIGELLRVSEQVQERSKREPSTRVL